MQARVMSTQKFPMVGLPRFANPRMTAIGQGEADRCGDELVELQAEHLGEVRHGRLAAVVLPVRVGEEAHRGVEVEGGGDVAEVLRVERQVALEREDQVDEEQR